MYVAYMHFFFHIWGMVYMCTAGSSGRPMSCLAASRSWCVVTAKLGKAAALPSRAWGPLCMSPRSTPSVPCKPGQCTPELVMKQWPLGGMRNS